MEPTLSPNPDPPPETPPVPEPAPLAAEPAAPALTAAPVRTISVTAAALLGGALLALGLAVGYTGRPAVTAWLNPSPTPTATNPPPTATTEPAERATQRAGLMDYVVANTRHFRGNPQAPITLIEFSDFQ